MNLISNILRRINKCEEAVDHITAEEFELLE